MISILVTIIAGLILACTNPTPIDDGKAARGSGEVDTAATCITVIMDGKAVYHCPDIEPTWRPE